MPTPTMNANAATTLDGFTFEGGFDATAVAPAAKEILNSRVVSGSRLGGQRVAANDGDIATMGTEADAAWALSGNATLVALLKALALADGTTADAAWGGSGAGSLVALLKALSGALGTTADTAWVLSGNATLDALLKAVALASGTTADAAYASGNGSLVALLKGVFARLLALTQVDANSYLYASLGTAIAGEDIPNNVLRTEEHATVNIINSNATTQVKSGAGYVYGFEIGDPGATWVISVYDALSATGTPFVIKPATYPVSIKGYTFNTGLCVVTSGTTAGTVAIRYR